MRALRRYALYGRKTMECPCVNHQRFMVSLNELSITGRGQND